MENLFPSQCDALTCPCSLAFGIRVAYLNRYLILSSDHLQKREAPAGEKPEPVRTHLRNMIIVPEMIGSVIGVYNGKTFNQVEIKVSQ